MTQSPKARTATKGNMVLIWRFRYAIEPSSMAFATFTIAGVPGLSASTRRTR
jgi:hypothetical protein